MYATLGKSLDSLRIEHDFYPLWVHGTGQTVDHSKVKNSNTNVP
jgi:hypothetical protein